MIESTTQDASGIANARIAEDDEAVAASSRSRNRFVGLQGLAFLIGFGLLVYTVNRVGVEPIFAALKQVGWNFLFIFLLSGARHAIRTLAMSQAISREHRHFTFPQAFAARIGGEAVTFLTFTGPLLGEATKAAMLKSKVPLARGVPALVVDNLLYNVSVALFILSGACVMLAVYDLPPVVSYALIFIAVAAGAGLAAIAFAVKRRIKPLSKVLDVIARWRRGEIFVERKRAHVEQLETHVYDFYKERRGTFFKMLGLDFLGHATSVLEVYVALRLLNFDAQLAAAYVIESLTKVINFAFGFVPGTIGVYEGGTEIILRSLGYAAATGVTLALVRKASIVCWTCLGLATLVWRGGGSAARSIARRHPRLQKTMDNLVFSNIAHRPARTFVSVLGVAIGVLLIVFTTGLANGVLRERGRRAASIGAEIMVRASGTIGFGGTEQFALDASLADDLRSLEGVRAATAVGQTTATSDRGFGVRVVDGINFEEYAALANVRIVEGQALGSSGDEAIIDRAWQQERGYGVGGTVALFERDFRIVGVYDPPGGGRIKIPLQTLQEQVGREGRATAILVACQNPAEQEQVAARVRERMPDAQILFTRDFPELYASSLPALDVFLSIIVVVAAAISMLVILLAMYTTVTERTRQIGILKALGMPNATIAWIIEQEAIIISVLGVALGVVLVYLARFGVMRATSLVIEVEWKWLGVALVIGLLGGTIGALYPALRAARQDAVKALSYE